MGLRMCRLCGGMPDIIEGEDGSGNPLVSFICEKPDHSVVVQAPTWAEAHARWSGEDAPEWISVKERLPEEWGYYLVYVVERREYWDEEYISKDERRSVRKTETYSHVEIENYEPRGDGFSKEVTHWMPLPEGPEGE